MIRSSHSKYLVVTWKQSNLKETKGLGLLLKRGAQSFHCSGAWTHWKWHQGVRPPIRMSRMQKQPDKELQECLLAVRRFHRRSRGLCLARLQCLISSGHLHGFMYNHLFYWLFCQISYFLQFFHKYMYKYIFFFW